MKSNKSKIETDTDTVSSATYRRSRSSSGIPRPYSSTGGILSFIILCHLSYTIINQSQLLLCYRIYLHQSFFFLLLLLLLILLLFFFILLHSMTYIYIYMLYVCVIVSLSHIIHFLCTHTYPLLLMT